MPHTRLHSITNLLKMKHITIFILLIPCLLQAQKVVFDTAYIVPSGDRFTLKSEVVYDDGRKVAEETLMDSAGLANYYANDIAAIGAKIASAASLCLERRDAAALSMAKSSRAEEVTGTNVLDAIGTSLVNQLATFDWVVTGIDTAAVRSEFVVSDGSPAISINGRIAPVYFYGDKWFRVPGFYGNGRDEDFFLFRGVYVNLGYNIVFSAVQKTIQKEKPARIKRRATNK